MGCLGSKWLSSNINDKSRNSGAINNTGMLNKLNKIFEF